MVKLRRSQEAFGGRGRQNCLNANCKRLGRRKQAITPKTLKLFVRDNPFPICPSPALLLAGLNAPKAAPFAASKNGTPHDPRELLNRIPLRSLPLDQNGKQRFNSAKSIFQGSPQKTENKAR